MAKDSRKPPSRIRYEQSHPTLSCRLDKQTHDLLQSRLKDNGLSFAQFVKSQLGVLEIKAPDVKKIQKQAYERGHDKGFQEAKAHYCVAYFCSVCGGTLEVTTDKEKQAVREYMNEHRWAHSNCVR